jgi:hypothetical protein
MLVESGEYFYGGRVINQRKLDDFGLLHQRQTKRVVGNKRIKTIVIAGAHHIRERVYI